MAMPRLTSRIKGGLTVRSRRIWKSGISISLFIALLVSVACSRTGVVWTGTKNFPDASWLGGERVVFSPDTAFLNGGDLKEARGVVSLRYCIETSAEEFPLVMETECPGPGAYASDTITVKLLPASERTAGNATLGIFEYADTVPLPIAPQPGWNITLHPAGDFEITGLYSLTFEIIR